MRVVFMGTPEFAVPSLKKLMQHTDVVAVYTQPDKPVGRGLRLQPSPVKALALQHHLPVFTPEKVSLPEEVVKLKQFKADFFVIVAYGQILKLPVIETPRLGCINIHSSLLPRWRGAAPIHWALLGGDEETGVTTMKIVPKLDAGEILLQEKTKITDEDTSETLHDRLSEMGAKLILPTLQGLIDGSLASRAQDEGNVTYAQKLTKEMSMLDGQSSAREVDLKVRALNPWPGVKIESENDTGLQLKIKQGKVVSFDQKTNFQSGTLFQNELNHQQLFLQCREGVYQLLQIQEEGKKAMPVADFLNGLQGRGISFPLRLKTLLELEKKENIHE